MANKAVRSLLVSKQTFSRYKAIYIPLPSTVHFHFSVIYLYEIQPSDTIHNE